MNKDKTETQKDKRAQQDNEPRRTPGSAEGDERTVDKALRNDERHK